MIAAMEIVGLALMTVGVGFLLMAALGIWRLPDVMTRLHALTKADTAGLALIAVGAALHSGHLATALVLALCIVLVAVSGATIGHLIARAHLSEADDAKANGE